MRDFEYFTKEGYIQTIKLALNKNYTLCPTKDAQKLHAKGVSPLGILRHDIDVDLPTALEMAKAEAGLGVKSTYFILLYEDLYNPLSPKGAAIVKEIASLGHEIGLHINSLDYESSKDVGADIKRDIHLLESVSGQKVISVAHHRPNHINPIDVSKYFENDAYSPKFMDNFAYFSDSCMKWRQHAPADIITEGKNFQFLSHPIWWIPKGGTVEQKITSVKNQNLGAREGLYAEFTKHILDALEQRKNNKK